MPSRTSRITAAVSALMIGASVLALPVAPVTQPAIARGAPESFAARRAGPRCRREHLRVANVENRGVPLPQLPPGTPFEDFFNDFFNRRGEGEGQQRGARTSPTAVASRRVSSAAPTRWARAS